MKVVCLLVLSIMGALAQIQPMFSGSSNCVACLGSMYYMCDTNTTKFACYQNQSQCLKFPQTSNIYSKCVLNATNLGYPVLSADP